MTAAVGALAVGCGAAFAKFRISNPEEIVTSAGGFLFMTLSALYLLAVLLLEIQPVRGHYMAALFRRPPVSPLLGTAAFAGAAAITAVTAAGALVLGARSLERRDL
jgi:ABC-2 type transport system permease protein